MDLDAGVLASLAPSGLVPGGVAGARIWRSAGCSGEDEGPDRVFLVFSEVLIAKFEDLTVLLYSLRVLDVNLCTPLY